MKNITFSADEQLIEEARQQARQQKTTLNNVFRSWLASYVARERKAEERVRRFDNVMRRTPYFRTDRKYTREEMNER